MEPTDTRRHNKRVFQKSTIDMNESEEEDWNSLDLGDLFPSNFFENKKDYIPWSHGGYKIYFNIKRFFCNTHASKKDINILEQVENLLNSTPSEPSSDVINKCHHFIKLHRIIENTNARKRLERWATKVIVCYLFIVLLLLILSSLRIIEISDTVAITVLSTTTVNIIGLGLIVLRGHFYTKEDDINQPNTSEKGK